MSITIIILYIFLYIILISAPSSFNSFYNSAPPAKGWIFDLVQNKELKNHGLSNLFIKGKQPRPKHY